MKVLKTDLNQKVRNLPSFKSEALLPVFEAIANSIHAIEEKKFTGGEKPQIVIEVVRDQINGVEKSNASIDAFYIYDNGIGFDESNYESFITADSPKKVSIGGKGVGRFLWLRAFDKVVINSSYCLDNEFYDREIKFDLAGGIVDSVKKSELAITKSCVQLLGFKDEYRRLPSAYKTANKIAQRILEHCLFYFISGTDIEFILIDGDCRLSLNELFESEIKINITKEQLRVGSVDFVLNHIRLFNTHELNSKISFCANGRSVKEIQISKSLGTSLPFDEENGKKFFYAAYVSSSYLDDNVDAFRMNFSGIEDDSLSLYDELPSIKEVEKAVCERAKIFLREYLEAAQKQKTKLVGEYVSVKEPSLRAVPFYCPEIYNEIEPNSSHEKVHEILYKHKGKAELEIQKKTEKLLKTQKASLEELTPITDELIEKITSFQKDNLVSYLLDRWRVLNILEKKIEINIDGKFSNEDIIHDIIIPRKTTTDSLLFNQHNLWIIDENLNYHAYAASDKPLNEITDTESTERPDVLAFAEVDESSIAKSVSIIELKKPQRRNFDQQPVSQVYNYLRKVQQGNKIKQLNGRDLRVGSGTKYYCYVLCDINDEIKMFTEDNGNYNELYDGLGYYTFNKKLNAWTQIIDFTKIVYDAKRRHKIFFEKLGIIK